MVHPFASLDKSAFWVRIAIAAGVTLACAAAGPSEITIPGARAFPESLSSSSDGTIFIGSFAEGGIFRVQPGAAKAEPWIKPGANDSRSTLGVLADDRSETLWVCSNDLSRLGVVTPGTAKGSALKSFDLKTGAPKGSATFPGDRTLCNDIAIGPDGAAYATDSLNPHVLRLRPGSNQLEVWATDPRFTVKNGAGLDGIAFGEDGNAYVDTFNGNGLFRIEVAGNGVAGKITELQTSRPIRLPDGMRPYGKNTLLMVEGAGSLDLVTIDGDKARIDTLKQGYDGPVAVTRIRNTAWVLEGQLHYLLDPKSNGATPRLPFRAYAVPLPGP